MTTVAIATGAGRGMGLACARELARLARRHRHPAARRIGRPGGQGGHVAYAARPTA